MQIKQIKYIYYIFHRLKKLTSCCLVSTTIRRYREDVEELSYLGVDFYRFSLSWSRLLPTGRADHINPDGVRYYHDLLDALAEKNIEPLVIFLCYY